MTKITDITKYGDVCKRFVGRLNGYRFFINETILPQSEAEKTGRRSGWYFVIEDNDEVVCTSAKSVNFATKEECVDAVIEYIKKELP